jgi:tetratricopeptide (TPR) repeat protein
MVFEERKILVPCPKKSSMRNIALLILLLLFGQIENFNAQNDPKKEAFEKGQKAIQLMDNGKIDEAIKILEECQKLDPKNIDYPYEIALANYMKKDYKKSIKILEELKNAKTPMIGYSNC